MLYPGPAVALDGPEVDSKSLSQSIRFIDLGPVAPSSVNCTVMTNRLYATAVG